MIYGIILGLSLIVGALTKMVGWAVLVGLMIDLCLFLWHKYRATFKAWRQERKAAKTASPGAPAPGKEKPTGSGKGLWKLARLGIALALIGWSWYSIENEVGFPGTYVAKKSYDHPARLILDNLQDHKLCGIEPGKWRFEFPQQAALEEVERHRKTPKAGFYIQEKPGIKPTHMSAVSNIMVNGIFSGKEKVTVGPDGCVIVSVFTEKYGKMLGAPVLDPKTRQFTAPDWDPDNQQAFTVQIRFY